MSQLRLGHGHRSDLDRPRSQVGETLIELTATVMLLGLGVVTVVSLMFLMAKVTGMHRGTTTANTWAHNIGESVISPLETPYIHCASTYGSLTIPGNYGAEVVLVERLSDPTSPTPTWEAMAPGCVDDGGVQRVTIEAWDMATPEQREVLRVVKRDTACQASTGVDC